MSILFADSFEQYGTGSTSQTNMAQGAWSSINQYFDVSENYARTGTRSLRHQNVATGKYSYLAIRGVTSMTLGVAFGIYFTSLAAASQGGWGIQDSNGNVLVWFNVMADGTIQIRRTGTGASIGTTDAVITAAAFNHIEFRILFDNVIGEIELRVNGVTAIILTDLNLGSVPGTIFYLGGSSGFQTFYFDDLIVWDDVGDVNNTFFGPARVLTVFANGEGADNDWTVTGAATAHEAIDETTPDGDTTYIVGAEAGDKQALTMPELPSNVAAISAIYIPAMAKLEAAGTGSIKLSVESDGEIDEGPDIPLTTSYTYWPTVFNKDPATDAPFTKAGLEAATIVIEKSA